MALQVLLLEDEGLAVDFCLAVPGIDLEDLWGEGREEGREGRVTLFFVLGAGWTSCSLTTISREGANNFFFM